MLTRYALRHRGNKQAMIKQVVAPPRLSDWTVDVGKAQLFENEREASDCARYITETAFNVEVFTLQVAPSDPRIQAEEAALQNARLYLHEMHHISGLERK